MDIETSEQLAFIPEQVESILMTVVDGILRTEVYLEEKVRLSASTYFNGARENKKTVTRELGLGTWGLFEVKRKYCLQLYVNCWV